MRIEIRNNSVLLDGYVNAVGRESRILPSPKGRFKEVIVPKTFERALMKADNVELLFNHLKDRKLGSIKEGNLELREDNIGLRAIATVTDDQIVELAKNGSLRGWSFGFITLRDSWEEDKDGIQKRMVEDMELIEVSILDKTPAYIGTSIEARGEEMLIAEQRNELDFSPTVEDKTEPKEEHKEVDEKQEVRVDHTLLDNEITLLKMKGSI